ncbi:MAG TPA: CBS domain-containing protein [Acidimicrobiia bacterium]|jgi:CBS domain-containing protein|nr:CBS domain-containing protein [Acidimicrobiia bacterium]
MPSTTPVRDVMTADVATLRPDQPVADAADALAAGRYGAMPVVDGGGKFVGLLRDEDLIASEARVHVPTYLMLLGTSVPLPGSMKRFEHELHKVAGATVAEVMDADPPTIGPAATLEDVATMMYEHDVTHLPVLDDGRVVGIVARSDIVKFIARTT